MKAKNGGIGMTDEEVKNFIARYVSVFGRFPVFLSTPFSAFLKVPAWV